MPTRSDGTRPAVGGSAQPRLATLSRTPAIRRLWHAIGPPASATPTSRRATPTSQRSTGTTPWGRRSWGGRRSTARALLRIALRPADARARAAKDHAQAAKDREQAARDRAQAARDRAQADADREALIKKLLIAETDPLTGARVRGAGLADLEREIDRTRRVTGRLVVAYVDVVGLKAVNDGSGHAAGDRLLQRVVGGIREHLRSYDLIVRVGGDEFVCALSGASLEEARKRFASISASLAKDPEPCKPRVGFAVLSPDDSAAGLIERADDDLLRGGRH